VDVREISAPIDSSFPCGKDIREDLADQKLYYKLKDARNAARNTERAATPGDPIRLPSEWYEVDKLAQEVLTSKSKDIEILAWLAEARLRIDGFAGLCDVFENMAELVSKYWDDLHSIDTVEIDDKVGPLAGLNGVGGEGTLIQAIRLTPIVPGAAFGHLSLWDYQLSQRTEENEHREKLNDAVANAGIAAMSSHLGSVENCLKAFDRLDTLLTERCGSKAPPASNIRTALQEAAAAIRVLAGIEESTLGAPNGADIGAEEGSAGASAAPTASSVRHGEISSREEALEVLLSVARYFRRHEPHSPISLAIETLVRRGRMDFSELLTELLPDEHGRNAVLSAAGIQPKIEKS
jgi:type VI secretion system protein ImpA